MNQVARHQKLAHYLHHSIESTTQLRKSHEVKLKSAVGIVFCEGKVLLGLSTADDEREGKWCFPGGEIDKGEDTLSASIREVYEEMGLPCSPVSQVILVHPAKPMVGFCILTCTSTEVEHNEEFSEARWFPVGSLPENILSLNIELLKVINYG